MVTLKDKGQFIWYVLYVSVSKHQLPQGRPLIQFLNPIDLHEPRLRHEVSRLFHSLHVHLKQQAVRAMQVDCHRDHSVYGISQWERTLQCNVLSHWLSPYTEWSLCQSGLCKIMEILTSHSKMMEILTNHISPQSIAAEPECTVPAGLHILHCLMAYGK